MTIFGEFYENLRWLKINYQAGQPIDLQRNYTLITSDYVATSSDYAALFKNAVKYEALNYLMRDAILDYLRRKGQQKEVLNPQKDGRTSVR
ncbi:MAG: hypothetical protein EAZ14_08725 [Runella slithyformis]|nr:MAG: hypothetical protein EAZ14_08725 [Runella slithyformis]